jgi:hypothetical protein
VLRSSRSAGDTDDPLPVPTRANYAMLVREDRDLDSAPEPQPQKQVSNGGPHRRLAHVELGGEPVMTRAPLRITEEPRCRAEISFIAGGRT